MLGVGALVDTDHGLAPPRQVHHQQHPTTSTTCHASFGTQHVYTCIYIHTFTFKEDKANVTA
jgi:hypothetical protein